MMIMTKSTLHVAYRSTGSFDDDLLLLSFCARTIIFCFGQISVIARLPAVRFSHEKRPIIQKGKGLILRDIIYLDDLLLIN